MIQKGVGPATTALKNLAQAADAVTGALPGTKGVSTGAGNVPVAPTSKPAEAPPTSKPAESATTSKLVGVNAQLADAVSKATAEYKRVTGKDATITSGVREREKQERMYNEWVAGGRKGKQVAPPGSSKHETGNAVDISQADANAMARLGILQKYGLNRPVAGDPVHVELANTSGPNSRYDAKTADIKPTSTLPASADSAQARAAAQNDRSEELLARWTDKLDVIARPIQTMANNTEAIRRQGR